jgi:hypothetical protein
MPCSSRNATVFQKCSLAEEIMVAGSMIKKLNQNKHHAANLMRGPSFFSVIPATARHEKKQMKAEKNGTSRKILLPS